MLPKKWNKVMTNNHIKHGMYIFNATSEVLEVRLYENYVILEEAIYNDNTFLFWKVGDKYVCRFDKNGEKHGLEFESGPTDTSENLWSIYWEHGAFFNMSISKNYMLGNAVSLLPKRMLPERLEQIKKKYLDKVSK